MRSHVRVLCRSLLQCSTKAALNRSALCVIIGLMLCADGNQRGVGKAFKQAFDDGLVKREDLFITSKLWNKVCSITPV